MIVPGDPNSVVSSPDFSARVDGSGACTLRGKELHILYQGQGDCSSSFHIRAYELGRGVQEVTGCVGNYGPFVGRAAAMRRYESRLVVLAERNTIIDAKTGEILLDEHKCEELGHWNRSYCALVSGSLYIRQIDRKDPSKGFDVFDLDQKKIVSHDQIFMSNAIPMRGDFFVGEGLQGRAALWHPLTSSGPQEFDCSGDSKEIIGVGRNRYAADGGYLIVAKGAVVVLVEAMTGKCLDRIGLLEVPQFAKMVADRKMDASQHQVLFASISNPYVILSGDVLARGYAICFEIKEEKLNFRWINHSASGIVANYFGGKWVFGVEFNCPVAWSVLSGEVQWRSRAQAPTNEFYASDEWLVYHQVIGPVHCYEIEFI